jgi:hypothetical protein
MVTSMFNMLNNTSLSTANYEATLNRWAAQAVQSNVSLDASPTRYSSAGAAARQSLITNYGWTINDGGLAP